MYDPFQIIQEFEQNVCDYTGAPYCVAVNSCTNALFLALKYQWLKEGPTNHIVRIPKRTYVSVPMQIIHAGFHVEFEDINWRGAYKLGDTNIYDSARRFYRNMYQPGTIMCTSHHWSKILAIQHGGCILHDDPKMDDWLMRARFDGRANGESSGQASMIGYHCPMPPENAAAGIVRLSVLPDYNDDLPNSNYPDLSEMEIFKPFGFKGTIYTYSNNDYYKYPSEDDYYGYTS